jgi:hypothetical protein
MESLDLRKTSVSDAGLRHLHELKRLREIYLDRTEISDRGADDLQQALPQLRIYR